MLNKQLPGDLRRHDFHETFAVSVMLWGVYLHYGGEKCPCLYDTPWWRHQMETCRALLDLNERNQPVTEGFTSQSPVTRRFDILVDVRM